MCSSHHYYDLGNSAANLIRAGGSPFIGHRQRANDSGSVHAWARTHREAVAAEAAVQHMTADGSKTWTVISPDLTTNDKSKQRSPAGIGPDGQDFSCTLIAIAESPIERGVM